MKVLRLALAALFLTQMAFADGTSAVPAKPTPPEKASWSYRLLGFIFKGLEESLQKSGLEFEVCSYQSLDPEKSMSAKGMGECLFMNFKEGLSKKGDVGVTYIWVKSLRGETLPVRVDWRPSEEGLGKMVTEVLTLALENNRRPSRPGLPRLDTTKQKPLSYKQNLLGHIRLTFPSGTKLVDFIAVENQLLSEMQMAKQIDLELTPLYKENGKANYKGVISIQSEVESPDEQGQWTIDFKTNMNFLKLSRPFNVQGHVDGGIAPEDMPEIPTEETP
ncbi:hypothetical protein [Bdellovibrio sp. HCB2-146]|uniref:hypothetical protein n=1 Tax=Bdellovibrio sp. HCB2-146 TaxID=3394362 RepID=UPI0039BD236D